MISNLNRAISRIFWILLLLATVAPMRSLAAEPTDLGKITIDIRDENGAKMSGDWYLHQGSGDKGIVLRNGTKGEVFAFSAGTYYLEVRNLKTYPFRKVFSANPQTLKINGAIQFTVQYFKTQAQWTNAKTAPVAEAPVAQQIVPAEDIAPAIETTPAETSTPAIKPLVNNHIKLNIVRPAEVDPWIGDESAAENNEYSLAVTGPEGLLGALSLLSLASGLWFAKRKNS